MVWASLDLTLQLGWDTVLFRCKSLLLRCCYAGAWWLALGRLRPPGIRLQHCKATWAAAHIRQEMSAANSCNPKPRVHIAGSWNSQDVLVLSYLRCQGVGRYTRNFL